MNANEQLQRLYTPHLQHNTLVIANIKFIASCFTGAAAGILGFENWAGFLLFVVATMFTTVVVYTVNFHGRPSSYSNTGIVEVMNPGQENIATFILVWTLFYGVVHVYD